MLRLTGQKIKHIIKMRNSINIWIVVKGKCIKTLGGVIEKTYISTACCRNLFLHKHCYRKNFSRARHRAFLGGHPCRTSMSTRLKVTFRPVCRQAGGQCCSHPFAMKPYVLSECKARVHELSEFRVLVGKKRGAGASRETVFRREIGLGNSPLMGAPIVCPKKLVVK
jgi:hypothetical protein